MKSVTYSIRHESRNSVSAVVDCAVKTDVDGFVWNSIAIPVWISVPLIAPFSSNYLRNFAERNLL